MWGVLAAILSSGIGGTAVVATRSLSKTIDPITLGALRFGLGFLFLLPVACLRREAWPPRRDWPGVVGLGLLFFGLFPILFNAALYFTTAARGAIALSALPVLTMLAASALRAETMNARKVLGVLVTMSGVTLALLSGLSTAPPGAWRGDLLMLGAAVVMALYTIWSRSFIARSGPVRFTLTAMGIGALCLVSVAAIGGGLTNLRWLPSEAWLAAGYLGIVGSALGSSYGLSQSPIRRRRWWRSRWRSIRSPPVWRETYSSEKGLAGTSQRVLAWSASASSSPRPSPVCGRNGIQRETSVSPPNTTPRLNW